MSSMVGALADEGPAPSGALEAGGGGTLELLNSDEMEEEEDEEGDGRGGLFFALRLRETMLLRPMVEDDRDGCGRLKKRCLFISAGTSADAKRGVKTVQLSITHGAVMDWKTSGSWGDVIDATRPSIAPQ